MSNHLELRRDPGGWRHYIDDVAIHCGDPIDAVMGGRWYEGRYEASWAGGIPQPTFYYIDDAGDHRAVRIGERTVVSLPDAPRDRFGSDGTLTK